MQKTITEVTENGQVYIVETYTNDAGIIKGRLRYPKAEKPPEPELPPLTEQEEIALDTALNVEYMVCLIEENLGLE